MKITLERTPDPFVALHTLPVGELFVLNDFTYLLWSKVEPFQAWSLAGKSMVTFGSDRFVRLVDQLVVRHK